MLRRVIEINEEKCTGCGLCVDACHEGAIGLGDGKARLMRDDYCDGLGDCLPSCPVDAITFVEREAAAYDEAAVIASKMQAAQAAGHASMPAGGCPGSMAKSIARPAAPAASAPVAAAPAQASASPFPAPKGGVSACVPVASQLSTWPIQIKLVPVGAPYFNGCDLLVAADCTAFAYGAFHEDFVKGTVCLIGCPKLDSIDYSEKLGEIISNNDIKSVTVVRMEVPCCGGIELAVKKALQASGKFIPWQVVTISCDGRKLD